MLAEIQKICPHKFLKFSFLLNFSLQSFKGDADCDSQGQSRVPQESAGTFKFIDFVWFHTCQNWSRKNRFCAKLLTVLNNGYYIYWDFFHVFLRFYPWAPARSWHLSAQCLGAQVRGRMHDRDALCLVLSCTRHPKRVSRKLTRFHSICLKSKQKLIKSFETRNSLRLIIAARHSFVIHPSPSRPWRNCFWRGRNRRASPRRRPAFFVQ